MSTPRTIVEKIWDSHVVTQQPGAPALLYIDLHLAHEVTSPQAFAELRDRGLKVRRPSQTIATMDHSTPTYSKELPVLDKVGAAQLAQLEKNCADFGIRVYNRLNDHQGIVHVIGPEQGLTQPGMTIVCGDSHTATHGAFGALAFGIGTSQVGHVLATQCLLQVPSKPYEIRVNGQLKPGVTAKDIILAVIAKIGIGGGRSNQPVEVELTGTNMGAPTVTQQALRAYFYVILWMAIRRAAGLLTGPAAHVLAPRRPLRSTSRRRVEPAPQRRVPIHGRRPEVRPRRERGAVGVRFRRGGASARPEDRVVRARRGRSSVPRTAAPRALAQPAHHPGRRRAPSSAAP